MPKFGSRNQLLLLDASISNAPGPVHWVAYQIVTLSHWLWQDIQCHSDGHCDLSVRRV